MFLQILVFSDSILKDLPSCVDQVEFEVHAEPGAHVYDIHRLVTFQQEWSAGDQDGVVLHVGTNHLEDIWNDIRVLKPTIKAHCKLVAVLQETFPGTPVIISPILPRFDWYVSITMYVPKD